MTLHKIKATVSFGIVKADELGGWIEKEENLDQSGDAWVYGDARVSGDAWVYGDARVYGNARVCGNARVYGNALVCKMEHILIIGPCGSRNAFTTFFRGNDNEIVVSCGCFLGKIGDFLAKVAETHDNNKHAIVYRMAVEMAKARIELTEEESEENEDETT